MKNAPTADTQYEQDVRLLINNAVYAVNCFAVSPLSVAGQRALLHRAKAGLAVDLIVPAGYLRRVGLTDRYRRKLTAAGGRFFVADLQPADWRRIRIGPRSLLMIDDETVWHPAGETGIWRAAKAQLADVGKQLNLLREAGTMHVLSGSQSTDIAARSTGNPSLTVTFGADSKRIVPGKQVRLYWTTPEATTVEIRPRPGRVPSSGSHSLLVAEPTEFTLMARRGSEVIAKILNVQPDRHVSLEYTLTAADPMGRRAPERLTDRPDLHGYFGALQGRAITLHWRTANANSVLLNDEAVTVSGEHTFHPQGRTVLRLVAEGIVGDHQQETIVVNTFTIPLWGVDELTEQVEPVLAEIQQLNFPTVPSSPLPSDAHQEPLARLDAKTRRGFQLKWRARNGGGLMGGFKNWLKSWVNE